MNSRFCVFRFLMLSLTLVLGGQAVGASITIRDFSRDFGVFDSDMLRGNNLAAVPLSGATDAPDGTVIEVRAVSVDDDGATGTAWQPAGVARGGAWSGTLEAKRSASWYRAEARVKGSNAPAAQTVHRFGVGLVIYHHRQSNGQRVYHLGGRAPIPDIGDNGNNLQIWRLTNRGGVKGSDENATPEGPFFIRESKPLTPALAAMAEVFHKNAPGLKICILADMKPGRSTGSTLSDTNNTRLFSSTQALIAVGTADGQSIGGVIVDHWNGIRNIEQLQQHFFGGPGGDKGVPHSPGTNHSFHEVMPGLLTGRTQMLFGMPGSYYKTETFDKDGMARQKMIHDFVEAYPSRAKQLLLNTWGSRFDGGPRDGNHWSTNTEYGAPLVAAHLAVGIMQAAGAVAFDPPRMDKAEWEADGSFVTVWSSAGPLTTIERQQALAGGRAPVNLADDLDAEPQMPGASQVLGFQFADFTPPARVEIVDEQGHPAAAGRLRVYPPAGRAFTAMDRLYFGLGEGGIHPRGSNYNYGFARSIQRHFPIVDMGLRGRLVEFGVLTRGLPDREWINALNPLAAE